MKGREGERSGMERREEVEGRRGKEKKGKGKDNTVVIFIGSSKIQSLNFGLILLN